MFSNLQAKRQGELLDLSIFGDELAFKTSWDPVVRGGNGMCTHELQKTPPHLSGDLLSFKVSFSTIFISAIVSLCGLGWLFFSAIPSENPRAIFLSLVFVGAGVLCWWFTKKAESVFDRSSRRLSMGGKSYNLDQVCAIQLIRELVHERRSFFISYELNLVCANAERICIVDHGSLRTIRKDAELLADYLSIPVWDAINFRIPEQVAH